MAERKNLAYLGHQPDVNFFGEYARFGAIPTHFGGDLHPVNDNSAAKSSALKPPNRPLTTPLAARKVR
jgi:hypothetical protein